MKFNLLKKTIFYLLMIFCITFSLIAADIPSAIKTTDLDPLKSGFYVNGELIERPTAAQLTGILGIEDNNEKWVTQQVKGGTRHFVIAFSDPTTIGTIVAPNYLGSDKLPLKALDGKFVSILKNDIPFPDNPNNDNDWMLLPAGIVKYLPAPYATRAIRFSDVHPDDLGRNYLGQFSAGYASDFGSVYCLPERYFNGADIGRISGINTGTAIVGFNSEEEIAGIIVFAQNSVTVSVSGLKQVVKSAPEAVSGQDENWLPARNGRTGRISTYAPDTPLKTKGFKVVAGRMQQVVPIIKLANGKNSPALMPKAPFNIAYKMPQDGFIALNIYDKDNKLIRRLVAEVARDSGDFIEAWDLTDDNGDIVPPGEYFWKAVTRPPFTLTYQMTAYNAGVPPWNSPSPAQGGGGWLADHAPGISVAAYNDKVWIVSPCAESGDSYIATDLEGNKLWGSGFIFGFDGPHAVTADDRFGYVLTTQGIFRTDSTNGYKTQKLFTSPNPSKPGYPWAVTEGIIDTGPNGIAVKDDKMYVAINAPSPSWLRSAFSSSDMNPDLSEPYAFLKKGSGSRNSREDKNYAWGEYDELMLFWSTFFTEKTPDNAATLKNYPIPHSIQSFYGDAPKAGKLPGSLIVAFRSPQTIGTIIIPDAGIRVFKLKDGVSMSDFDLDMPSFDPIFDGPGGGMMDFGVDITDAWDELTVIGRAGNVGIVIAPEGGFKTGALRYQTERIKYSLATARRFQNVEGNATITGTHGATANKSSGITFNTSYPFNKYNYGAIAISWPEVQENLRGLMLLDPAVSTKVWTPVNFMLDQFIGSNNLNPADHITDDTMWRKVCDFSNENADILNIDFGELITTKGLRIRLFDSCVFSAIGQHDKGYYSGFSRIIALKYLGGDPIGLPVEMPQRIVEFNLPDAENKQENIMQISKDIPLSKPVAVQFSPDGNLYALSDGNVVTVPLNGETSRIIVKNTELTNPQGLAIDSKGLFYITDSEEKIIKVFDQNGNLVKTIGKAGGPPAGIWDPNYMVNPAGISVDKNGNLWMADNTYVPKRIQRFDQNGNPDKTFLGPTQYGGGGYMDSKSRDYLYYQGMKFTLDWDTYNWELTSLLGLPVELTLYYGGHRYITTGLYNGSGNPGVNVAFEIDNKAVPVVYFGILANWFAMSSDNPEIVNRFSTEDAQRLVILWTDTNGDRKVQLSEVQSASTDALSAKRGKNLHGDRMFNIGEDMTLYFDGARIKMKSFNSQTGVPEYDLNDLTTFNTFIRDGMGAVASGILADAKGRIFMVGTRLIGESGNETAWDYFNKYAVHAGFYNAPWGQNRPAGIRQQEHSPIGHFKSYGEEYFVTNSDCGEFYVYTEDGLLLGCIVGGPVGYGLKNWNVPEWENGVTNLDDLRVGQEHYQGNVAAPDDKQVYAIAGHNHMSVIKVDGFESIIRLDGKTTVTGEDLIKTSEWKQLVDTMTHIKIEPKITRMPLVDYPVNISADFNEWPDSIFATINRDVEYGLNLNSETITAEGAVAYDADNLYLAIRSAGNLKNTSVDPLMMFKGGESADFTLGLDPDADPLRTSPVAGDIRILISVIDGKPVAVLYKPVDPGASAEVRKEFSSPVGRIYMDRVEIIKDTKINVGRATVYQKESARTIQNSIMKPCDMWHIEIAIPWKSIGLTPPKPNSIIKGDFGILRGDQNSMRTISRQYWSGKTQTVISDIPSEARLNPSLWGEIQTLLEDRETQFLSDIPISDIFGF